MKFGCGSIMVWGCFCSMGVKELKFISCKMNFKKYIDTLEEGHLSYHQKSPNPLLVEQDESWDGPQSTSSRKRKRMNQDSSERRKTGSKPDMSIRLVSGGGKPLEFGACEAAAYYEGHSSKKYQYESTIKLPKMLKDMLFDLCEYVDWDAEKIEKIGVEGCIQSVSYHDPPKRIYMSFNSIEEF
ncbi:hypothetical protein CLU79DRAFT_522470 [Phycomyces nitens]|nr:hypothetical protein CLU79DRAFT_522470 [Phycomyces nitens]